MPRFLYNLKTGYPHLLDYCVVQETMPRQCSWRSNSTSKARRHDSRLRHQIFTYLLALLAVSDLDSVCQRGIEIIPAESRVAVNLMLLSSLHSWIARRRNWALRVDEHHLPARLSINGPSSASG